VDTPLATSALICFIVRETIQTWQILP
jgi:hypothetical protein